MDIIAQFLGLAPIPHNKWVEMKTLSGEKRAGTDKWSCLLVVVYIGNAEMLKSLKRTAINQKHSTREGQSGSLGYVSHFLSHDWTTSTGTEGSRVQNPKGMIANGSGRCSTESR